MIWNQQEIKLTRARNHRFFLFRVKGAAMRPLRFEMVNMDGRKVRKVDVLMGNEFVVNIANLAKGEYLFALSSSGDLLQTGVIAI